MHCTHGRPITGPPCADCRREIAESMRDTTILDALIDEYAATAVHGPRLEWEPGTLGSNEMDRILTDVTSDIWADCYRQGERHSIRVARFRERMRRAVYAATGEEELAA